MTDDLLRFSTAGSVDDGKSTLIGRLLFETKQIVDDHLEAVERASKQAGADYVNLALLTDGLRAEREQGITIDVAYRYFSTDKRKFIIADTPGHVQYTRNMVTGASTADLAIVLVDARKGLVEQSRRHTLIASLLRVPHLTLCVNKMDLVDYSRETFESITADFQEFARGLEFASTTFIPVSALVGDNVVEHSSRMPWYVGPALLTNLESVPAGANRSAKAPRFPVQWVVRPFTDEHHDYRGYAGQVAGGTFHTGDDVLVLPSGLTSRIASIERFDEEVDEAFAPMSVVIRLEDELDVSRGDMLCQPVDAPRVSQDVEAHVCWFDEKPMRINGRYIVKHTTHSVRGTIKQLAYRLDINTLEQDGTAQTLEMNQIGRIQLRTSKPLCHDPYSRNRSTGSFILIDEGTNRTVAAGMIL